MLQQCKGANKNHRAFDGSTPLCVASQGGHIGIVKVLIEDGSAGFAAETETLIVKTVADGQACAKAGVLKGMQVAQFQHEMLPPNFTWAQLKEKVKAAPKPWTFVFVGTVALVVPAGAICNHVNQSVP